MPPVISIQNLVKTYVVGEVEVRALRGVSLDVQAGEFVAITGPSGSGKSTLMHILGCLDRPTSGQLHSRRPGRLAHVARTSSPTSGTRRSVSSSRDSICCRGRPRSTTSSCPCSTASGKLKAGERHRLAMEALTAVGLRDRSDHQPNQLSGGQQQRVAIARALITTPSILLADEPTGNLDTRTSVEVMEIFQRLNIERGITVLAHHARARHRRVRDPHRVLPRRSDRGGSRCHDPAIR